MVWANACLHVSMHAIVERGRLFKSFRMALDSIWEHETTSLCMLNHLVRRKLRRIAQQQMFILQVVLFSQLRQLHMLIHRTYINTVYCSYGHVHSKQSVYLSSFCYNFLKSDLLVCYGVELKTTWTTPTPSHQFLLLSLTVFILSTACQVDAFNHHWEVVRVIMRV